MKKVTLAVLMIFMMMFVVAPNVHADTLTWTNVTIDYGTGFWECNELTYFAECRNGNGFRNSHKRCNR